MVEKKPDLGEIELDDLEKILQGHEEEVRDFLDILHPADVADLIERVDEEQKRRIFGFLPVKKASETLVLIEELHRDDVLDVLTEDYLARLLDEMETDDVTDLIAEFPPEKREKILASIDARDSAAIRRLLLYPEDSAGGLMQAELVSVRADSTVSEAIQAIREKRDEIQDFHFVFVVDEMNRLAGILDLPKLILAEAEDKVKDLMDTSVISVNVHTDQEEVAKTFIKYDLVSMPVVDDQNRLVGRILVDDVMDVIEDEVDEDFLLMAGAGEEELEERSIYKSVSARLPWLFITWIGEIITGLVIGFYGDTLQRLIILTTFIPVILAMGGNVGTQSSTIVVRGLATGRIEYGRIGRVVLKEILVGLFLGIIIGIVLAAFARFRYQSMVVNTLALGGVVGVSICVVMTVAAFIGTSMPMAFRRFGIDPAVATAPFVSMSCDIFGTLIYLTFATMLMAHLV
jgi:magnesium transporter